VGSATGSSAVGASVAEGPQAARTNAEISRRLNSRLNLFFITSSPCRNIGLIFTTFYILVPISIIIKASPP
jgi:hypothetical protein